MITMQTAVQATDPAVTACVLQYNPDGDRHAIALTFIHGDGEEVQWLIGRELFTATLLAPYGAAGHDGDVMVVSLPDEVDITLRGEDPNRPNVVLLCTVTFPRPVLDLFYALTTAHVPVGHEMDNVNIDAELAALLAEAGGDS